jgi:hypothetical protein
MRGSCIAVGRRKLNAKLPFVGSYNLAIDNAIHGGQVALMIRFLLNISLSCRLLPLLTPRSLINKIDISDLDRSLMISVNTPSSV